MNKKIIRASLKTYHSTIDTFGIPNPTNPYFKLLIISSNNDDFYHIMILEKGLLTIIVSQITPASSIAAMTALSLSSYNTMLSCCINSILS